MTSVHQSIYRFLELFFNELFGATYKLLLEKAAAALRSFKADYTSTVAFWLYGTKTSLDQSGGFAPRHLSPAHKPWYGMTLKIYTYWKYAPKLCSQTLVLSNKFRHVYVPILKWLNNWKVSSLSVSISVWNGWSL